MARLHGLSFILLSATLAVRAADGYTDPNSNGGSMLTTVLAETFPAGQQEPINMIISGASDAAVLKDQDTDGGLQTYFLSLSYQGNCLGAVDTTSIQQANLGDGNGLRNQTAVMRYNYGNANYGTCTESVNGGDHFRYWIQNGSDANSGAIFMAVSYELPSAQDHDIVANGYNYGRDYIVGNITGSNIPTLDLNTSTLTYSGETSTSSGWKYKTSITYVTGLLPNSSIGINHNETVAISGVTNAVDGLVAVLTVSITAQGTDNSSSSQSDSGSSSDGALGLHTTTSLSLGLLLLPLLTFLYM